MTARPVLEAHDIEKTLGQGAAAVRALMGVSMALYSGELTLLRGPSGSGKTTLMSILGGILAPTSGSIHVAGQCLSGLSEEVLAGVRRKDVGFIFQSYNLFPTLTALQNVTLAGTVQFRRAKEASDRASAALEAVGLSSKLNSYPAQLSGGEQQRVAVARAIAGGPSVLLADEPTAALDGENGRTVMALLSHLAASTPCAVLVVTHDERTLPYADRVISMEDGRIINEQIMARGGASRNGQGEALHV